LHENIVKLQYAAANGKLNATNWVRCRNGWTIVRFDGLAKTIFHPRMLESGIYDFMMLQSGFPPGTTVGMTICKPIKFNKY
jgi:hypothetical protein